MQWFYLDSNSIRPVKAGFQLADFSASANFFAWTDFSAYPQRDFHHNAEC